MFEKYKSIIKYLFNSILVTILDVCIVWCLNIVLGCDLVIANTCGVVAGTIVGYFLTAQYVFVAAKGKKGFIIYILTFLLGLILANIFIYIGNRFLFVSCSEKWNFLMSKGLSIVGPFFILYNIRKKLYT
jgi:putative flippase GtrA